MKEGKIMTKIKFNIGSGEIRNCWVDIIKSARYYQLFFDNGSYDYKCKFNKKHRYFYGAI